MKIKPAALVILLVVVGMLLPGQALAEFTSVPDNFDDQQVARGLPLPTAFDWLPASEPNRLLVATQGGMVFRIADDGNATQILNLVDTVCSGGETGLLGLAVDPSFSAGQRFIYLYYTDRRGSGDCSAASRANRVSRFTMTNGGLLGNEQILIDNIPAPGGNHNGGDLQFGIDGLLYVSVGDGGQDLNTGAAQNSNGNARRLDVLVGKILRIEPNGGIPAGNPFQGPGTARCASTGGAQSPIQDPAPGDKADKKRKKNKHRGHKRNHKAHKKHNKKKRRNQRRRNRQDQGQQPQSGSICQEIFATGLRNPFRIAFGPSDTSGTQPLYINDVGGTAWEEIDVAARGADYGWNVREGPCPTGVANIANCSPSGQFTEPLFAYTHSAGCGTITGGAFVPDVPSWSAYEGVYLYADFNCGKIFALRDEAPGETPDEFASGTSATNLAFGPDGDLYYATFESDGVVPGGQVRKIVAP